MPDHDSLMGRPDSEEQLVEQRVKRIVELGREISEPLSGDVLDIDDLYDPRTGLPMSD